jgi:hypothetical protein
MGATLALCLGFSHPAAGQGIPQPTNVSSTLYARDSATGMPVPIQDSDFAKQLQDTLTANGKSNVKDAVFLFQQCYGGGFLIKLKEVMNAAQVVSVGGSASAFDKVAHGPALASGGPQFPESAPWTHAIFNTISSDLSTDPTVTLYTELEKSKGSDETLSGGRDTPQVVVTGEEFSVIMGTEEGKQITLKDPEAKSHHAILFAGASKKGDGSDYEDVTNLLNLLKQAWGEGAGADTQILFGDGTHQPDGTTDLNFPGVPADQIYSATKENLAKALAKVKGKLNTDEQFVFYATDHGGSSTASPPAPSTESTTKALFQPYAGQIEGAQQLGAVPTVTVQFLPQPTSVQPVLDVDGQPVGALDTSGSSATFAVNGYLFQPETEVTTEPPFAIQEFILSTGPVDKFPPPSHGQPLSLTISGPPSVTTGASTMYVTYQASVNFADGSTITVFPNWKLTTTAPGVTIDPYTGFVTIFPISTPTTVKIQATWTDPATGTTVTANQTVVVGPQPTLRLACPTEVTAMQDGSYASSFNATGGTGSYITYSITGSLPSGLTLNSSTGAITGSPTASGTFTFEGAVADTGGHTALSPTCIIIVETFL